MINTNKKVNKIFTSLSKRDGSRVFLAAIDEVINQLEKLNQFNESYQELYRDTADTGETVSAQFNELRSNVSRFVELYEAFVAQKSEINSLLNESRTVIDNFYDLSSQLGLDPMDNDNYSQLYALAADVEYELEDPLEDDLYFVYESAQKLDN